MRLNMDMAPRGVSSRCARAAPNTRVTLGGESYYTYRPSYAVAVRAPHGIDVHAGYSPWPGGLGEVLSGPPGVRVVHFLPIRPHHRTGLLRLESGLSAVAGQRGVLVRSSWARRLARVAGHRPQPPGSRLVYDSWFFIPEIEFRCYPLGIQTRRATAPRHLASTSVLVCGSERERGSAADPCRGGMTPLEDGTQPGR